MADPYIEVVRWNNAEGGIDGTTVTSGNSGGASGGSFSPQTSGSSTVRFTSTNPIHGSMSYRLVGSSGFALLRWLTSHLGTLTTCCGTVYFRLEALPSGYTDLIGAYTSDSGGSANKGFAIRVGSGGNIRLSDGSAATIATSIETIAANTVYRLEWQIDHSADTYVLEWFAGDSTVALGSISGTASSGAFKTHTSRLDIGRATSPDITVVVDSVAVDSKKVGPRLTPSADFLPVAVVSNDGGYSAVGGTLLGVVRDDSDATYIESPVEPSGASIVYELGPRSRTDTVTVTYRDWRSDDSVNIDTTLELVDLDEDEVLGSNTYTATETPTDYTVVSDEPVPTSVRLGVRITTDTQGA